MDTPIEQVEQARLRAGDVVAGKYALVAQIGVGGMGEVWNARNLATEAEVALKFLLASRTSSAELVARFQHEAHATAQLSHRGIVRVFDLVELGGPDGGTVSLVMVMERLRGKTLATHLEEHGPLSAADTLAIVLPMLSALGHVHRIGLVHRDVKPENVFLAEEPDDQIVPKLLDFGIAKRLHCERPITVNGSIVGTPSHMSPEQLRGDHVDARSDVFSVGIVLCMCLTGENPFASAEYSLAAMTAALDARPRKPAHVPAALWSVIDRALEVDPSKRYADARELADALVAAGPGLTSASAPPRATSERWSFGAHATRTDLKRRRFGNAALCVGALTVALISIAWTREGNGEAQAAASTPISRVVVHAPQRRAIAIDRLRLDDAAEPIAVRSHHASARARYMVRDPGF